MLSIFIIFTIASFKTLKLMNNDDSSLRRELTIFFHQIKELY